MDAKMMNILNMMENRTEEDVKITPKTTSVGFENKILEALAMSESAKKMCESKEVEDEEVIEEVKEVEDEEVITESVTPSGIDNQDLVDDPGLAGVYGEVTNIEDEEIEEDFVSRCLECGVIYKGDGERCVQCGSTDTEIFGEIFIGGDVEIDEETEEVEEMEIYVDTEVEEEEVLTEAKKSKLDLSLVKTKEDALRVVEVLFSQGNAESTSHAIDIIFDYKLSQAEVQKALDNVTKHKKVNESTKKIVRGGQLVKVQVKTKKAKLSPEQKKALAKARKKAHTADAEKARQKSMQVRKKKLKENYNPDHYKFNVTVMLNNKPLTTNDEFFDVAEDELSDLNISDWGTNEIYCSSKSVAMDIAKVLAKHAKKELKGSFTVEVAEGEKVLKVFKESVEVAVNESLTRVVKINESLDDESRIGMLFISENADRLKSIAEAHGFTAQADGSFMKMHESEQIVLDTATGDMNGVVLYATDNEGCMYSQADLTDILTEANLVVRDQIICESVSTKRRKNLVK